MAGQADGIHCRTIEVLQVALLLPSHWYMVLATYTLRVELWPRRSSYSRECAHAQGSKSKCAHHDTVLTRGMARHFTILIRTATALWCAYEFLRGQDFPDQHLAADACGTRLYVAYCSLWFHCESLSSPSLISLLTEYQVRSASRAS